jgi:hypothetical protein
MTNSHSSEILIQKEKLKKGAPELELIRPCTFADGIINLNIDSVNLDTISKVTWFIPASGSGSRMFQVLNDFLNTNDKENSDFKKLVSNLNLFAFYYTIDKQVRQNFEQGKISISDLLLHVLSDSGLNLGKLPKGLVPFHITHDQIFNAFQEQVLQGIKLPIGQIDFHFTIQKEFEEDIVKSLDEINSLKETRIHFSVQEKETDSLAFDMELNPIRNENGILKRPSGHGALLTNLNRVESEFILIKNIDNIQHIDRSQESTKQWTGIIQLLKKLRLELFEIWKNPDLLHLRELNKQYQIFSEEQLNKIKTNDDLKHLLNRPIRVCGMVKNSGQPGGGPFWVKRNGVVSKQIIEKDQISNHSIQQEILNNSSHFNPVMIAASVYDFQGIKFDLSQYVDEDSYFIVHKTYEGKVIQYLEKAGLWNGSMAYWNSVFVELPSEVFSPVKSILDLMETAHQKK